VAVLLPAAGAPPAAVAGSSTTFSGQATVISGTVAGQNVNVVNAGPIPTGGGSAHNCLLAYPTSPDCQLQTVSDQTKGAVTVEVLGARAAGQGNHSHASASAATLKVDFDKLVTGLPALEASFLDAEANAVCQTGVATAGGTSEILGLTVAGVSVDPTLGPITVGPFTILFNQVKTGPNGTGGQQADVKTLEIMGPLGTDLVIGSAHADISCGTGSSQAGCSEKITGGGWYDWPPATGNEDHFALAASEANPTWGHFLFSDKKLGLKFHGAPDFAFLAPGSASSIPGTSKSDTLLNVPVGQGAAIVSGTNAQPFSIGGTSFGVGAARFVVVAIDNGEGNKSPGDVLGVVLLDAGGNTLYQSNATASLGLLSSVGGQHLGGGNLKFHDCH
jgi:hypothetical protein